MIDKSSQIWHRYKTNRKQLNLDCIDLISKCYLELGQKPTPESIALMGTLLLDDLAVNYGRLELDEVKYAFSKGIRDGEEGTSCFINVRTWNVWLTKYKKAAMLRRQQNLITEYQQYKETQKQIGQTINQAKRLK